MLMLIFWNVEFSFLEIFEHFILMGHRLGTALIYPLFWGIDVMIIVAKSFEWRLWGASFNDAIDITSFLIDALFLGVHISEPGHENIVQGSGVLLV